MWYVHHDDNNNWWATIPKRLVFRNAAYILWKGPHTDKDYIRCDHTTVSVGPFYLFRTTDKHRRDGHMIL